MKLLILICVQLSCIFAASFLQEGCHHDCQTEGICYAFEFKKICYYVFTDNARTWKESNELCNTTDLSMVELLKENLQKEFYDQLLVKDLGSNDYLWLGGNARNLEIWTYVNEVKVNETLSTPPPAFRDAQEMHVCAMVLDDFTIDKDDCCNIHNFVCRFNDWHNIPSLYVSETPATWFEARSRCIDIGGDLFYLNKGENFDSFKTKLSSFPNQRMFIGLTHRIWQWEAGNGQIEHYNWQDKEPNALSDKCLAMYRKEGSWNDADCEAKMYAFCQRKYISKATTNNSPLETCQGSIAVGILSFLLAACIIVIIILVLKQKGKLKSIPVCSRKKPGIDVQDGIKQSAKEETSFKSDKHSSKNEVALSQHEVKPLIREKPESSKDLKEKHMDMKGGWNYDVSFKNKGDFCTVALKLPGLRTLTTKEPSNAKARMEFNAGSVFLEVIMKTDEAATFTYNPKLPKEIDQDSSSVLYQRDEILLKLKKLEENVDWEKL